MPVTARFMTTRYTIVPALRVFDTIPELADHIRDFDCTEWNGRWFRSPNGTFTEKDPAVFIESDLKPRQLTRTIDLVTSRIDR